MKRLTMNFKRAGAKKAVILLFWLGIVTSPLHVESPFEYE